MFIDIFYNKNNKSKNRCRHTVSFLWIMLLRWGIVLLQGKAAARAIPERKAKSVSVCDDSKSRPNNDTSRDSLPAQASAASSAARAQRKSSLGSASSLPLPQRSLSQGRRGTNHELMNIWWLEESLNDFKPNTFVTFSSSSSCQVSSCCPVPQLAAGWCTGDN